MPNVRGASPVGVTPGATMLGAATGLLSDLSARATPWAPNLASPETIVPEPPPPPPQQQRVWSPPDDPRIATMVGGGGWGAPSMGALPFAAKGFGAPIGAPFGTPFNSQPMAALSVQDSHGLQPQPLEAGEASQNRSLFNGVQQRTPSPETAFR